MPQLEIAFALERFARVGGVRVVMLLANGLARRGHSVRVLVGEQGSCAFPVDPSVRIECVESNRRGMFRRFTNLRRLIADARNSSDVLYLTSPRVVVAALTLPHIAPRTRELRFAQGTEWRAAPSSVREVAVGCLGYFAASWKLPTIAVSAAVADAFRNSNPTVISNGIDLEYWRGLSRGEDDRSGVIVLVSGNRRKFGQRARRTCEALRNTLHGRIRLTALADGDFAPAISGFVRQGPFATDDELRECFASYAVFVALSESEGFGMMPLEAAAAGAIPVTVDNGGCWEFLAPSDRLVFQASQSKELTGRVGELVAIKEQRNIARRELEERLPKFGLAQMLEKHEEFCLDLVNRGRT